VSGLRHVKWERCGDHSILQGVHGPDRVKPELGKPRDTVEPSGTGDSPIRSSALRATLAFSVGAVPLVASPGTELALWHGVRG